MSIFSRSEPVSLPPSLQPGVHTGESVPSKACLAHVHGKMSVLGEKRPSVCCIRRLKRSYKPKYKVALV